jgi:hypothetical protein
VTTSATCGIISWKFWKIGMRVPVGSDGWYLCDWRDQPDHEYTELRGNKTFAMQWANQFRGDFFALGTLRRLLGGTFPARSDEQIAQEVAWRLAGGIWVARRRRVKRVATGGEQREDVAPPFPMEDRRSPPPRSPSPGPEAPLFPGDTDLMAIAEAQKQAAALGIPFCEECLRAQLANR